MENDPNTHTVATLALSGSIVHIGSYNHHQGSSVWFKTEENPEPIYLKTVEARLLIAAFKAAISELKEES